MAAHGTTGTPDLVVEKFRKFDCRTDLAEQLSQRIIEIIDADVSSKGKASAAFSGGTTPKRMLESFFANLSKKKIAEGALTITVADERMVPLSHERSNFAMLKEAVGNSCIKTSIVPLFSGDDAERTSVTPVVDRLSRHELLPCSAIVLGMGTDGHTASWFAGSPNLPELVDPQQPSPVLLTQSDEGEPRLTMTLSEIARAQNVFLHIEGEAKLDVFNAAMGDGPADELPIRHILRHPEAKVIVYWAP